MFCSGEHDPQSRKLIALWHMAGPLESLTPPSAGRTSKLWASGKFSLFQARETSVLPKWILVFGNTLGYYKYNLSEVCVSERKRWRVCIYVCMHMRMRVWWQEGEGVSTGLKPTSISVKNMRSGMEKNVHYVPNTKFRIFYCFFPEEMGEGN